MPIIPKTGLNTKAVKYAFTDINNTPYRHHNDAIRTDQYIVLLPMSSHNIIASVNTMACVVDHTHALEVSLI